MTRLTLMWELRAYEQVDALAREALAADDAVAFLNAARGEAWRAVDVRTRAADYLSDHLWPDDSGVQRPTWVREHATHTSEVERLKDLGMSEYPTDGGGERLEGYHAGGLWFPNSASAERLGCPECGFTGEFWDWTEVDAGTAVEPDHVCPRCGWKPPEGGGTSLR